MTSQAPLSFLRQKRPGDPRLGEVIDTIKASDSFKTANWVIVGHPDDEGIRLNGGRPGASGGPEAFRRFFYNLVAFKNAEGIRDSGDSLSTGSLAERHQYALDKNLHILKNKSRLFTIGGGHDYGYPDIAAFLQTSKSKKPLVINLDAHLDLRPADESHHSGTPFRRICDEFKNVELIEFGFQNCFASNEQLEYAKAKKIKLVPFEERTKGAALVLKRISAADDIFLSVDIDAFSSSLAPGASAAWPIGLLWSDVEKILLACSRHKRFRAAAIYELAPALDENDKTAKLAAQIGYLLLRNSLNGRK